MNTVLTYILSVFITLQTVFSLLPQLNQVTYAPTEQNIILNCAVVSDTHADNNSFRDRTNILRKAYTGIGNCAVPVDVLLNVGDITNSGSVREYRNEERLEDVYIKQKHTVACMGNHDSWNGSADPHYNKALNLFLKYLKTRGIETETPYYATVIAGYHFICLATESVDLHEMLPTYSQKQLDWFDAELTKGEASNLPVFVLCHKPLAGHNGITESSVPQGVEQILQNHSSYGQPILFFSGHHHTFARQNYEQCGNVYYINLPSTEYNDETENTCNDAGGMGLTMEIYGNKIILRSRNFIKNKNIEGYEFIVPLNFPT